VVYHTELILFSINHFPNASRLVMKGIILVCFDPILAKANVSGF